MKTVLALLACLCILVAVLQLYTLPTEPLWPASMIAREIWPWFIAINSVGVVLAVFAFRPLIPAFAAALIVAVWPATQIAGIVRAMQQQWREQFPTATPPAPGVRSALRYAFCAYPAALVEPQKLPLGIHLYRTDATLDALRPVIVNIHGGSWQRGTPTEDGRFSSYFARRGWAVFSLDYRFAPASRHPAQIDDVRASLRWVHEHAAEYGADPAHIVLVGRSAGGHLALLAAFANDAPPIRSVVSYYAPVDLAAGYADLPVPDPFRVRTRLETFIGGSPDQLAGVYREASPSAQVRRALPPILLVQGAHDCVVKPRFTRELRHRLLEADNRALLLEIPWSDHAYDFVYFGAGNSVTLPFVEAFLLAT
jgi:acetyl esterase/lipase